MNKVPDFATWFRNAAPYINAHRGRTFVVQFGGETLEDPGFAGIVHDFALLHSLGVRLVLVHGARPQIETRLREAGLATHLESDRRVTHGPDMGPIREAIGAVRSEVEALLSMGIANSPMAGARIRVSSGNFVTARPVGIIDGVDYGHTGTVRRIDREGIEAHLHTGAIVLVSPLGYSPTGELFNLRAEEVATALAVEVRAAKLLFLGEPAGLLHTAAGGLVRELTLEQAKAASRERRHRASGDADDALRHLEAAIHACRNGVGRAHLLDRRMPGALIAELFSRDGVGTMISADAYDVIRRATIEDIGGILALIEPLEHSGALVRRSREKLEAEIDHFFVAERDGAVVACTAMHAFEGDTVVELACLAVDDRYANAGRGEALLQHIDRVARAAGATRMFVLTTQATHWFRERGFTPGAVADLPVERRERYSPERGSRVLVRSLD